MGHFRDAFFSQDLFNQKEIYFYIYLIQRLEKLLQNITLIDRSISA